MKKVLSLVLVLGAVFLLAGCGNKPSTLVCSQKVSIVDVSLTTNFTGNTVSSMSMKYVMDLSKYSDSLISTVSNQDYCKTVQNAMSQYTLVDCKQALEGKSMVITSGIDITKMSKSDLTGSPSATKEALEKQGYTCTLK
jgi:uncharacterized lipoprotein YehR (DUF1307 family)